MQTIKDIYTSNDVLLNLMNLLERLYKEGPVNQKIIENLTYYKEFYPTDFVEFEEKIISTLGLFYKNQHPNNVLSLILFSIGKTYNKEYGAYLTPVQASIYQAIQENQYISISAPTSAGKSYAIRDYIQKTEGDCIIVVPSRALIAEYMKTMLELFQYDKNVMVSPFIDLVFTDRKLRRIFVLTPERTRELFTSHLEIDIKLFFFDEAHVSEEKARGIIFDSLVRRSIKKYPLSKMIFAHPFVENPDAQMLKHDLNHTSNYAYSYPHNTVGKIFVCDRNNEDYYFSPFEDKGHHKSNMVKFKGSFEQFAFDGSHRILIYISKLAIYKNKHIDEYDKYIDKLPLLVDPVAISLIEKIEYILGVKEGKYDSTFAKLLRKGVVIHHGSVPLDIRFLIEDFIRSGFAIICFATSTLAQGINMPFDIVWLDNNKMIGEDEKKKSLDFKNLIGRSGRLTKNKACFDYGYVYTKNPKLACERMSLKYELASESVLNADISNINQDDREFTQAIVLNDFDDDLNLPKSKIERLESRDVMSAVEKLICTLSLDRGGYKELTSEQKYNIELDLYFIYCQFLNRELNQAERAVFRNAIYILFYLIEGKSFREIVAIRYGYITSKKTASFSQPAEKLPNTSLQFHSIYPKDTDSWDVSYDRIVFDTYDYLDKVLAFSLVDTFVSVLQIYQKKYHNLNTQKLIDLFRFGTLDSKEILLLRYGFSTEHINIIMPYVISIDEMSIVFKSDLQNAPSEVLQLIQWYLP